MASRRTSSSASRRHAREADLARREGVSRCEASRLVPGVRSVVLAAQFGSRRLPARVGPRGCSSPSVTSDVISEGCAWRGRGRGRRAPRRGEARGGARAPRGAVDLQQDQPAEGRVPRVPGRGRRPGRRRAGAGARGDPSAHARVRLGQSRGVRARARRRARTRRARRTRRNHPDVVPGHVPIARQGARRRRRARRERRSTTGRARISRRRIRRLGVVRGKPNLARGRRRATHRARRRRREVRGDERTAGPRRRHRRVALAFATSDSFRLAGDALARASRAPTRLRRRRVPGRSRRREIGARDAHQRRLQTSRTALLRDDGRSSRRLAFGSSRRLAFGSSRRLAFGSSRRLASRPLRLFAFGSPSEASDALLCVLVLCKIASRPVESGGAASAEAYRARSKTAATDLLRQLLEGPSASAWLVTFRDFARGPLCAALLRAADEDPVRVVASEPRGAKRVRGASRVGARGVRGAGDSRAIVV